MSKLTSEINLLCTNVAKIFNWRSKYK